MKCPACRSGLRLSKPVFLPPRPPPRLNSVVGVFPNFHSPIVRKYSALHLYFPSSSQPGGVRIPHSLISLHAIQPTAPPSIYLQLQSSDSPHDDDNSELTFELTLIPLPSLHPEDAPPSPPEDPDLPLTQALYDALRIAADMWSDMEDEDDVHGMEMVFGVGGDGEAAGDDAVAGLPPPMPGSGGWITSDNVGYFFDGEGNWREREAGAPPDATDDLGEGAGTVRPREDHPNGGTEGVNGEETKRRRID